MLEQRQTNDRWQPFLFALVLIIGMFLGYKLARQSGSPSSISSSTSKARLDDLIRLIANRYVDTIDESVLYKGGIEGILKNLDPHTVYIPASELTRANEELEGTFYGIGVEFYLVHDTVTIASVIKGGPSEKENITPGDKIIKIDDSLVAGKKIEDSEIIRMIRGQKNTDVELGLRHLDGTSSTIHITRGNVPLRSVPAWFMIDEETGYIKIDMFSETTYDEFKAALQDLNTHHISKLIIDVRDNPGGYMDAVANVADELVAGTHTIVSTKGKRKSDSLVTSKNGIFEKGKLCILVDENSASASEILAGAMQDLDRGTIVGRRTFGKGLVQEQFELPDHAAIRITTARYYLPSGRSIQRSYAGGKEKYRHDIMDRFTNGALKKEDSLIDKPSKFYTLKKRIVYGDDGIRPDVFVALDTTYHKQLDDFYSQHIAEEFADRYFFFHQNEFQSYKNLEIFSKEFNLDENMLKDLKLFFIQQKINTTLLDNPQLNKEIKRGLSSQFAKLLFGNNGRYKELYRNDEFILKAIQSMKDDLKNP